MSSTPSPLAAKILDRAGQAPPPREHRTRPLTGVARPPLILLAGGPKVGKSFALAAAAADPRVDRVTVVEVGSDSGAMDEYGAIPGAAEHISLVEHNGTWTDVAAAIQRAVAEPPATDGYGILAVDGVTQLWALLSRDAQRGGRDLGPGGWSAVNETWDNLLTTLRAYPGPVVLTARTDEALDDSLARVRTQKELAYGVDVVVQATGHRAFTLTGARSLALAGIAASVPVDLGDLNLPDLLDLLTGRAA